MTKNDKMNTKTNAISQRMLSALYAGAALGTTVAIIALARPKLPTGAGE